MIDHPASPGPYTAEQIDKLSNDAARGWVQRLDADVRAKLPWEDIHDLITLFHDAYSDRQGGANARAEAAELLQELKNIARADPRTWEPDVRDHFQQWAQNRARRAVERAEAADPRSPGSVERTQETT